MSKNDPSLKCKAVYPMIYSNSENWNVFSSLKTKQLINDAHPFFFKTGFFLQNRTKYTMDPG